MYKIKYYVCLLISCIVIAATSRLIWLDWDWIAASTSSSVAAPVGIRGGAAVAAELAIALPTETRPSLTAINPASSASAWLRGFDSLASFGTETRWPENIIAILARFAGVIGISGTKPPSESDEAN